MQAFEDTEKVARSATKTHGLRNVQALAPLPVSPAQILTLHHRLEAHGQKRLPTFIFVSSISLRGNGNSKTAYCSDEEC